MFPLSRRCRNTLIRVLRSRIFGPDKEFCRLRAAAKGVSAGRSSLNVRQKIYMAIQIVWRRRNEVSRRGTGGSGISRHRSINGAETSESACGPQRVSQSASQPVRRAYGSLAASVAGLSRLALALHERSEPKLVVLSGLPGCLLIENHAFQRCADIGHAPGDQQAFGLLAWFTLNDFEQPCRGGCTASAVMGEVVTKVRG